MSLSVILTPDHAFASDIQEITTEQINQLCREME